MYQRLSEKHRNVGCYIDEELQTGERAFPTEHEVTDLNTMTLSKCFSHCRTFGKRYAALQEGHYCTCGDDGVEFDIFGIVANTECNIPCTGNSLQTCGGTLRNSVYDLWGKYRLIKQYHYSFFSLLKLMVVSY